MINDLTINPPRSAAIRLGGYAILARTIDKCRATLADKPGEYHFDCPVDKQLFEFKGITSEEFKNVINDNKKDEEIIIWMNENGTNRTVKEINEFSDKAINNYPALTENDFGKWFIEECIKLSLEPKTTTLFHYLDIDDKVSFVR